MEECMMRQGKGFCIKFASFTAFCFLTGIKSNIRRFYGGGIAEIGACNEGWFRLWALVAFRAGFPAAFVHLVTVCGMYRLRKIWSLPVLI
jgi:hypothetical protein